MRFVIPELTYVFHTTVPGGPATLAAIVATDDLQVAYNCTNHIHDNMDWRELENVLATMWSTRSTAPGDYLMQGKKVYVVEQLGFSRVNGVKDMALDTMERAVKRVRSTTCNIRSTARSAMTSLKTRRT
jgi:hypothetical protein